MPEAPTELAHELREQVKDKKSYLGVIDRLNKASVDKHWEAYADIPWDDPEFTVDKNDPRWVLPQFDRLGDRMSDVPDQMGYRVQDLSEQARNLIEDSPLAVGAVAVAVGTAIGAAIPSTSAERRVLRPAAERAIGTAEDKATEALDQAEQRLSEATSGQGSSGTSRSTRTTGSGGTSSSPASSSSRSTGLPPAGTASSSSGSAAERTRLRQRDASS